MKSGLFLPLMAPPLCLVAVLCLALSWSTAARATEVSRTLVQAESGLGTAELVSAILGYTAWPGRERTSVVLCVSRAAPEAAAILSQAQQQRLRWPLVGRGIEVDEPPPAACDAIYFEGWQAQAQRQALRGLAGRPVLSIGSGSEFCSDGGLFCLAPGSAGLRFEVNLDAVARSGLRVHPQVLRLARPRAVGSTG